MINGNNVETEDEYDIMDFSVDELIDFESSDKGNFENEENEDETDDENFADQSQLEDGDSTVNFEVSNSSKPTLQPELSSNLLAKDIPQIQSRAAKILDFLSKINVAIHVPASTDGKENMVAESGSSSRDGTLEINRLNRLNKQLQLSIQTKVQFELSQQKQINSLEIQIKQLNDVIVSKNQKNAEISKLLEEAKSLVSNLQKQLSEQRKLVQQHMRHTDSHQSVIDLHKKHISKLSSEKVELQQSLHKQDLINKQVLRSRDEMEQSVKSLEVEFNKRVEKSLSKLREAERVQNLQRKQLELVYEHLRTIDPNQVHLINRKFRREMKDFDTEGFVDGSLIICPNPTVFELMSERWTPSALTADYRVYGTSFYIFNGIIFLFIWFLLQIFRYYFSRSNNRNTSMGRPRRESSAVNMHSSSSSLAVSTSTPATVGPAPAPYKTNITPQTLATTPIQAPMITPTKKSPSSGSDIVPRAPTVSRSEANPSPRQVIKHPSQIDNSNDDSRSLTPLKQVAGKLDYSPKIKSSTNDTGHTSRLSTPINTTNRNHADSSSVTPISKNPSNLPDSRSVTPTTTSSYRTQRISEQSILTSADSRSPTPVNLRPSVAVSQRSLSRPSVRQSLTTLGSSELQTPNNNADVRPVKAHMTNIQSHGPKSSPPKNSNYDDDDTPRRLIKAPGVISDDMDLHCLLQNTGIQMDSADSRSVTPRNVNLLNRTASPFAVKTLSQTAGSASTSRSVTPRIHGAKVSNSRSSTPLGNSVTDSERIGQLNDFEDGSVSGTVTPRKYTSKSPPSDPLGGESSSRSVTPRLRRSVKIEDTSSVPKESESLSRSVTPRSHTPGPNHATFSRHQSFKNPSFTTTASDEEELPSSRSVTPRYRVTSTVTHDSRDVTPIAGHSTTGIADELTPETSRSATPGGPVALLAAEGAVIGATSRLTKSTSSLNTPRTSLSGTTVTDASSTSIRGSGGNGTGSTVQTSKSSPAGALSKITPTDFLRATLRLLDQTPDSAGDEGLSNAVGPATGGNSGSNSGTASMPSGAGPTVRRKSNTKVNGAKKSQIANNQKS